MSDNEEGWQVVRRRKGRKSETSQVSPDSTSLLEPLDVRKTINRIRVTMWDTKSSSTKTHRNLGECEWFRWIHVIVACAQLLCELFCRPSIVGLRSDAKIFGASGEVRTSWHVQRHDRTLFLPHQGNPYVTAAEKACIKRCNGTRSYRKRQCTNRCNDNRVVSILHMHLSDLHRR